MHSWKHSGFLIWPSFSSPVLELDCCLSWVVQLDWMILWGSGVHLDWSCACVHAGLGWWKRCGSAVHAVLVWCTWAGWEVHASLVCCTWLGKACPWLRKCTRSEGVHAGLEWWQWLRWCTKSKGVHGGLGWYRWLRWCKWGGWAWACSVGWLMLE